MLTRSQIARRIRFNESVGVDDDESCHTRRGPTRSAPYKPKEGEETVTLRLGLVQAPDGEIRLEPIDLDAKVEMKDGIITRIF